MKRIVLGLAAVLFAASPSLGHKSLPFSWYIDKSDFIGQYQTLLRDGDTVGSRLVEVYWEKDGYDGKIGLGSWKAWDLDDFNKDTDILVTTFVFNTTVLGNFHVSPDKGMIQFPYDHKHGDSMAVPVGGDVSCSATEFHEILTQAGDLKKRGEKIQGNLTLTVFGKEHRAR